MTLIATFAQASALLAQDRPFCEGCGSTEDIGRDAFLDLPMCRSEKRCYENGIAIWNRVPKITTYIDDPSSTISRIVARHITHRS